MSDVADKAFMKRRAMADGGEVAADESELSKSMKKAFCTNCGYSEGGMVSNDTEKFSPDSEPSQYDELVKDDDLKMSYTGKDSGDEDGNEALDEEDKDVVSSVMKSRKKKDKNPKPA